MLKSLRWLSRAPHFLQNSGNQSQGYRIRIQPIGTSSSSSARHVDPTDTKLKPTGSLPPLQNDHEFSRTAYKSPGQTVLMYKRGHGDHAVLVLPGGLGK